MNDPKAPSDWLKVDGIDALVELALNPHWSWNHAADGLWEGLDKELWATTQNQRVILRTVSREKIKAALREPEFRLRLDNLLRQNRESYNTDAWFQHKHPGAALSLIAYFSMEFMLSEALPVYSGGLGNVAGDRMKAASDLGVPVVGVGLLYGQGYFRQDFDSEGRQQALYPVNDPGQLPIRPCVNGGLNLSELDGWWAEAYSPEVGWAIGDGREHGEDPAWDAAEAEALYNLLEHELIPEFYERDEKGMPSRWLEHIRESMARLTSEFSATRAIREYTENHYLPAASGYHERAAGDSALGVGLLHRQRDIDRHWSTVRLGAVEIETHDGQHFFEVKVCPGALNPDQLRVELYADSVQPGEPALTVMTTHEARAASSNDSIYLAQVSATRRASDYTARIIPTIPALQCRSKRGRSFGSAEI